ncbi:hypothetical protein FQN54_009282 [Arachnomyces sp. PD_36]|nr:hypothetical protein FQN54_009282 [Arachnomyces sp. PD_36]
MRFLTLAAASSLLGLAAARIEGFSVPATIKPGEEFDAILHGYNYIQTVDQVAAAFGVSPGAGYPDSLGVVISSVYLGPEMSNEVANYTFGMTVDKDTALGKGTFTTSLFSLYGAADAPTVENYAVPITFGDETSEEYVHSKDYPK